MSHNGTGDTTFQMNGDGVAPSLSVSPASPINFNDQRWNGGTPQTINVTITNSGDDSFLMSNLSTALTTGTHWSLGTIVGTFPVAPTETLTLPLTFNPTALGTFTDTLTVSLNNDLVSDPTPTRTLNGNGIQSTMTFGSSPFVVGSSPVGSPLTNTLVISNTGAANLIISGAPQAMDFSGGNATDFSFVVSDHGCTGQTCNPVPNAITGGASNSFGITCTPSAAGLRSTTLTVRSDDPTSPRTVTVQCTGQVPLLSTNPASTITIAGTTQVGQAAAVQNLVISNGAGASPLNYSIVSNSATEFPLSCMGGGSACLGGTVVAGASTTVQVGFVPQASGARSSTLTITSNDPDDNPKTITVNGTGGVPTFSASPSPMAFGSVPVAQTGGATLGLNITNGGPVPLDITNDMTITGDPSGEFTFAFGACTSGQTCGTDITVGANSTTNNALTVRCDPASAGAKTATLNIPSDASGSPHQIMLTCTGTVPDVSVSSTSLTAFPDTRINTTSPTTRTFTVSNTGPAPMTYTVTETSPHFSIACTAPGCSGSLNMTGSITVTVSFTPTAIGSLSANILVSTPTDPDEMMTSVAVTGTGVQPLITLDMPTPATPPSTGGAIAFGNVNNGTTSGPATITVRNNGTMDLSISAVNNSDPADFDLSAPANALLTPGMTQSWTVNCDPETRGAKVGNIQIVNNSENDTSVDVALTCTSIEGLIVITASPVPVVANAIDFGPVRLTQMRSTTVTLTNQGNVPVTVSSIMLGSTTEGFSISGFTAGTMVNANNGTTTFTVVFAPTLVAQGMTTMTVATDWNDPVINLTGDGQLADMVMTPDPVDLMNVQWDGTKNQTMTITNLGTAQINVMGVSLTAGSGEFTVTQPTTGNLGGGQMRTFTLTATPSDTMLGLRSGTVRLTTDLPPGMGQFIDVPISYTSVGPSVTVSPGMVVDFGGVDVDAGPQTMRLDVMNSGTGVMDITSVGPLTGVFSRTNFVDLTIDPNMTGSIVISYDPTTERDAFNPEMQNFVIATDGLYAGGTQQPANIQITVRGFGTDRHLLAPNVTFPNTYRNPTDAQVPTTTCGATMDQSCAVRICNTGGATLDVSMIDDPDDAFELSSTAALQVAGGSDATPTCAEVAVAFRPTAYGSFTGAVTIVNNDNATPMAIVTLSGNGIARPVTLPATVDVGVVTVGDFDLSELDIALMNESATDSFVVTSVATASNTVDVRLDGGTLTLRPAASTSLVGTLFTDTAGPFDATFDVYLDGDSESHGTIRLTGEAVEKKDYYTCSTGRSSETASALLLALLAAMRPRRRRVRGDRECRTSAAP